MRDGMIPKQPYTLYLEWGFAQTRRRYHQLSEKLKLLLDDYASPQGGVAMGIDPCSAVLDHRQRQSYSYGNNLLNPENRDFLNEIFACLGLDADTTFDRFAEALWWTFFAGNCGAYDKEKMMCFLSTMLQLTHCTDFSTILLYANRGVTKMCTPLRQTA